jgi:hypothetical protein
VFGPDSVEAVLPVLAESRVLIPSLVSVVESVEGCGWGLREAIAIGAVRAMPVRFDIIFARKLDWRAHRGNPGPEAGGF